MKIIFTFVIFVSTVTAQIKLEPEAGFGEMTVEPSQEIITDAVKIAQIANPSLLNMEGDALGHFIEFVINGAPKGQAARIIVNTGDLIAIKARSAQSFGDVLVFNVKIGSHRVPFSLKTREMSKTPKEFAQHLPHKNLLPGGEYKSGLIKIEGLEVEKVSVKWSKGKLTLTTDGETSSLSLSETVEVKNGDEIQLVFPVDSSSEVVGKVSLTIGDLTRVATYYTGSGIKDAWSAHMSMKWYVFNEWQLGEAPQSPVTNGQTDPNATNTNSQFSPLGLRLSFFMYNDYREFKKLKNLDGPRAGDGKRRLFPGEFISHFEGFSVNPLVPIVDSNDENRVILQEDDVNGLDFQSLFGYGWLFPHRNSDNRLPEDWQIKYAESGLSSLNGTWLHLFASAGGRLLKDNDWKSKYHFGLRVTHQRPGKILNGAWMMISAGTDHLFLEPRLSSNFTDPIEKSNRKFITAQIPLIKFKVQDSDVPIVFRYQLNHGAHLTTERYLLMAQVPVGNIFNFQ